MSVLFILGIYVFIICSFIFIMLFGPNEMFKGTIIEKIHWFLTIGARQYLLQLYKYIFGKELNTENKFFKAIFGFRHRFIQLFYLSVSLGGIVLFFYTALYRLPNRYLGPIHFFIMPIVIAFIYVSFYIACVSDPGFITKENVDGLCKHFKYDHVLYSERQCKTCQIQKPARSKHCSTCGHCVAKSDHHCTWINNCVGYLNFRWFLLFLFSNIVISIYGCYLSFYIMKDKATAMGLDSGYAYNRITHQYEKIGLKQLFLIMINEEPILCALFLFLGASALVVIGFAGYQSYLTGVAGMTTNELAKWGRLEGRLEDGESFITKTYVGDQITEEDKKIQQQQKEKKEKEQKEKKVEEDGLRKRKGNNKKNQETLEDKASAIGMEEYYDGMIKNGYRYTTISKFEVIENQYNYGVFNNFKEIFFPKEDLF